MTTLHEEPSSRPTLIEEVEDSYSETDENDDSEGIAQQQPPPKSKFPMSKTMGSLHDIGSSNFNASITGTTNAPANVTNSVAVKQTAGTPSMTSSTSSGYGSQAVSYTNLTNDDTLSLHSMSVDDTPGEWMPSSKCWKIRFDFSQYLLFDYRFRPKRFIATKKSNTIDNDPVHSKQRPETFQSIHERHSNTKYRCTTYHHLHK